MGSRCGLVSLRDRFTCIFENCHLGAGDLLAVSLSLLWLL